MRMTNPNPLDVESEATRLLPTLEIIAAESVSASRDAARYAARLRFSLDRIAELQERVQTVGGVFEPARLAVAHSILRTHHRLAGAFVATVAASSGVTAAAASHATSAIAPSRATTVAAPSLAPASGTDDQLERIAA